MRVVRIRAMRRVLTRRILTKDDEDEVDYGKQEEEKKRRSGSFEVT